MVSCRWIISGIQLNRPLLSFFLAHSACTAEEIDVTSLIVILLSILITHEVTFYCAGYAIKLWQIIDNIRYVPLSQKS